MAKLKVNFEGNKYLYEGNWFTGIKVWLGIESRYEIAKMIANGQIKIIDGE